MRILLLALFCLAPIEVRAEEPLPDGARRKMVVTEDGEGVLWSIAFSPDGGTLACGGSLKKVHLFNAMTGELLRSFGSHPDNVWALAWSPDCKSLYSGGRADLTLRVWNPATGDELESFKGHRGGITRIRVFRDGKRLVMSGGSWDPTVRIWDVARREQLMAISGHADLIDTMDLASHGRLAITGSRDGTMRMWNLLRGREIDQQRLPNDERAYYAVAFSPDARMFAFGTSDGRFEVRETITRRQCLPASEKNGSVHAIAFSSDGRHIAFTSETRQIVLWDAMTGKEVCVFRGHRAQVHGLSFHPDGRLLASCASDSSIILWNVPNTTSPIQRLSSEERETHLAHLGSENPVAARRAIIALTNDPGFSCIAIEKRLKPAPAADAKRLAHLIAQLGRSSFLDREKATTELERLGDLAAGSLVRALQADPSLEQRRRLERLLDRIDRQIPSGELLWQLRATAVLEARHDAACTRLLQVLADGDAGARLTIEAQEILARLR